MKKTILFVLFVFYQLYAFANELNTEDAPRFVLFLGRFHPLILHLPIGALLITFYLDIIGRIKKNYPKTTIKYALGFSSFFAILASILGYFLSLEGGYNESTLDIHFWVGILSAVLTSILFVVTTLDREWLKKIVLPLFIITLISIGVTGHYGSVLTHGDNFITEYAGSAPKIKTIEQVDSLKIYKDVVANIFEDKCTRCHNSTKKKGELSLLSKAMILKGGENGDVVHSNNVEESKIYTSAFLPLSDDNHMPPEGKPQLSKDELWILKYWINNNLDFTSKVAEIQQNDTLNRLLKKYLVFERNHIPNASISDIVKVKNAGFSIRKLVPDKAGLSVKFLKGEVNTKEMKTLSGLKEQIIELDLSNSNVSDKMTKTIRKLKNLKRLRLENTRISDESLNYLNELHNLKLINLYNTNITNRGLEKLLQSMKPNDIYIWKTKVEKQFAMKLEKEYDVNMNMGVFKGFVEKMDLKKPLLLTKRVFFQDTISVRLLTKMKNLTLRYTLNGKEPDSTSTIYLKPITLNEQAVFKVKAYKKDWYPSETLTRQYAKIKYIITDYTIVEEPDSRYPKSSKLFDLKEGSINFRDGNWAGFLGSDLNTTIDLGEIRTLDKISVNCLENSGNYILLPKELVVYASKKENSSFKKIGNIKIPRIKISTETVIKRITLNIPNTKAQYFKIIVKNQKVLPKEHVASGEPSWMFVDEIVLW